MSGEGMIPMDSAWQAEDRRVMVVAMTKSDLQLKTGDTVMVRLASDCRCEWYLNGNEVEHLRGRESITLDQLDAKTATTSPRYEFSTTGGLTKLDAVSGWSGEVPQ